ncbi:uncharacterized protein C1orf105 homolog [Perognathus longimembris pacificus]|uniref:uncharacterized protein C1orf105 homolog n=1 Tax=Perognathus longimembris pacificus TaxID=214514 RepID=UPI002019440F|nr:uncharacterized protein C1orf105 homolog [Perognathus longimembris pacificus]
MENTTDFASQPGKLPTHPTHCGMDAGPGARWAAGGEGREDLAPGLASVPKFDKVPWLSEASIINKPLVLSLPQRSPHFSATSFKKNLGLPILFQVPDDLWKEKKNQSNVMLVRKKQLCPTCQEIKMVQPTMIEIPDDLKLSFEKLMYHSQNGILSYFEQDMQYNLPLTDPEKLLELSQGCWFLQLKHVDTPNLSNSCSCFLLCYPLESIHYRLPIIGPRSAAFHGLLSDAYRALEKTQHSSLRKAPMGKTVKQ